METACTPTPWLHSVGRPYLLGKSIEWKQRVRRLIPQPCSRPYLLGKSIEWKRLRAHVALFPLVTSPYLLGKSIEWKPGLCGFLHRPRPASLLVREIN